MFFSVFRGSGYSDGSRVEVKVAVEMKGCSWVVGRIGGGGYLSGCLEVADGLVGFGIEMRGWEWSDSNV